MREDANVIVAPGRRRAVKASLCLGAFAVIVVESASAFHALNRTVVATAWIIATTAAVILRRRLRLPRPSRPVRPLEWFLIGAVGALLLAELVVAILAEPNNFDSQTYHLPRIEHWVTAGDVGFFPTAIHRQDTIAPGGEFLLTHLRLLSGSDALYNLVQWFAGVLCILAVSRVAAQLGGGRRAQLLTAFLVATTPMAVLQASSTQVDLIAAAWVACLATLVLDGLRTRLAADAVIWLGLAAGLAAVTKATGALAAGVLLLTWVLSQALRSRSVRAVGGVLAYSLGVVAVAAVLVGPFLSRTYAEFGNILGPPRLTNSIAVQRHDPAALMINSLRIAHTALDTPWGPLRRTTAAAVESLARAVGVDPQDPAITFPATTFPVAAWYPDEDRVAQPIQGILGLFGTIICLVRPRRFTGMPGVLRAYAATVIVSVLAYMSTVKWQPWGNRLLLYAPVLGAPLAALWLDRVLNRRWPGRAVISVIAAAALSATLAVGYGFPRRLVGPGSVFTTSPMDTRFLRRPQWRDDFIAVSAAIKASGARRIGIVQQNDNWEYPWWILLRGREFVALQTFEPSLPAADPSSVEAIVCTGSVAVCARYVPGGWTLVSHGYAAYALPPAAHPLS